MRRAAAAAALLMIVAVLCALVSVSLYRDTRPLVEGARRLATCEEADADAALEELQKAWESVRVRLILLVGRGCTDPVEETLARIETLLCCGEEDDAAAEAAALGVRFEGMWRSGAMLWENIG
jgi:hypothetical protein